MKATQTERVLSMLRVAGKQGIRSDEFFHCGMPRGAARIRDLKDEGVQIESEREGKYCRYRLVEPSHQAPVEYAEDSSTGCWVWQRGKTSGGYGITTVDGRQVYAHRALFEHHVGQIPDGLQIDHLCRNRACVNPGHLEPVTPQENQRRGLAGPRTHCPFGHPYTEENTYRRPSDGGRSCLACRRARNRGENPANAGVRTEGRDQAGLTFRQPVDATFSPDSGVEPTDCLSPVQLAPPERSVPSCFDVDVSWERVA